MYTSHALLREPSDEASLWRYMDLAKFLALLENRSLYLANLKTFEDPFEGHPPRRFVEAFTTIPKGITQEEAAKRQQVAENNRRFFSISREFMCASCWHMNEIENAGMWAQYLRSGEGIAVKTSFARLKKSLAATPPDLYGAIVQYIDYETFPSDEINVLAWGALKRQGFDHEKEFRLLTLTEGKSLSVAVDLAVLVQDVYVAPNLPLWYFELVKALVARYQLEVPVHRSALLDAPAYFHFNSASLQ